MRTQIERDFAGHLFGNVFASGMAKPHRTPDRDEQAVLATLRVELISPPQKARWNRLVRKHHYLKSADMVGEQLRYVVIDDKGQWLALLGWSAAALHLKARDQSIEWSEQQRERRLHLIAQNSRFVILAERQQWPNLASRALSLCSKRLSADWQKRYRHPIVMMESFVDRQLFRGTAYKASGWPKIFTSVTTAPRNYGSNRCMGALGIGCEPRNCRFIWLATRSRLHLCA
jgi:hypothetical protein